MVRMLISIFLVTIVLLTLKTGEAYAEYQNISTLYRGSLIDPSITDPTIEGWNAKSIIDNQFLTCLYELRREAGIKGANSNTFCNELPYQKAAECRKNNWAASVYLWTISIERVIEGEKQWKDTPYGQLAFRARQFCEALGSCNIQNRAAIDISQRLVCD